MSEVNEWQLFFDNHAHVYMQEWYTQNWRADVDLFEDVLHDCHCTWESADSVEQTVIAKIRTYLPTELNWYLQQTGFVVENMWGGDGAYRHKIQLDEYMIMVVAKK